MQVHNYYQHIPQELGQEWIEILLQRPGVRLERIVSRGQATPEGEWYDQDGDEWVLLLQGAAQLKFADQAQLYPLFPGDYLLIPAHCRHRVEWTSPEEETIWLAIHFSHRNE